jgi:hypothetical protein
MGLTSETRRDVDNPRHWRGLAGDDAALLATWIERLEVKPDELHTGIPVGRLPVLPEELRTEWFERLQASTSSFRLDAAVRFGSEWWLIECKPDAGHMALGQLVFYRWWWQQQPGYPIASRLVVLTDDCDADFIPVFETQGIEVIRLGEVLGFSRRRRRRIVNEE